MPTSSLGRPETVYPYGNKARAEIISYEPNGKVRVCFLDECVADFGWYSLTIFDRGYVLEIDTAHLHKEPSDKRG